jgi:hypothetical protein
MKRDDKDAFVGSVAKKDLDLYDPKFRVHLVRHVPCRSFSPMDKP